MIFFQFHLINFLFIPKNEIDIMKCPRLMKTLRSICTKKNQSNLLSKSLVGPFSILNARILIVELFRISKVIISDN